ncbi:enamine deaminase RidA (YjgF/YER057c/UK114 family) [Rhizobium aquaticum]|uniref:Enamine deaminase RidA (YjgF/YER057c/UK114 family) n=1 Tax=Rhizobium aquaticum TaxID=1549636 RepID=A0ABV2J6E9_9HYPH
MSSIDRRIRELGLSLPTPASPVANYLSAMRTGNLLYISGQGPIIDGRVIFKGRIGDELTEQEGYEAARLTAMNLLAVARSDLGSLDRIAKIVKLNGWVRSAPGYDRQPSVINGASDLFVEVFGEKGRHARTSVSAHELPMGIAVEIEMIAEIES